MDHITAFNAQLLKIHDEVSDCYIVRYKLAGDQPANLWFRELGVEINRLFKILTGKDATGMVSNIELLKGRKDLAESIKIYLIELYLKAAVKDPQSAEYALWVGLVDTGKLEQELPLTVNKFYLKVWKTKDDKALDEMQISNLQQLITGEK